MVWQRLRVHVGEDMHSTPRNSSLPYRNGSGSGMIQTSNYRNLGTSVRANENLSASYAPTTTPPQKRAAYASRPKEQRDKRQRIFHARLAAVNGVVIPSTLAPGEVPQPKNPQSEDCKYQCPICRGWYKRRYHVQSHFAKCVEMYGNPNGARWDDTWKDVACRVKRGSLSGR